MSESELVVHLAGADLYRIDPVGSVEDQERIAHLIAASPALYDFLEAKAHHLPIEDQHAAYLLLAKARGEQP